MFTTEKVQEMKLALSEMNDDFHDDVMKLMTADDYREITSLMRDPTHESDYFSETMLKGFHRLEYLKENHHTLIFTSGMSVENCDFSGDLQLRVVGSTFSGSVQSMFNYDYNVRYVLEYQFRKDTIATTEMIEHIFYDLIEAREDVDAEMPFFDEEDDERYDKLLAEKLLQSAEYVSCYVKLFYFLSDVRLYDRHTRTEVNDFELLKNHVFKTIPKTAEIEELEGYRYYTGEKVINFKNMFKMSNGSWLSKEDFEFLSHHKISIIVTSYSEMYRVFRKSTFEYDEDLKVYKHSYQQKEGGRCYGYAYVDEIHFKSHEDINNVIDSTEKNKQFKIELK